MKSALTAANRILLIAWQKGLSLSPLQLMKLTYMSHGWSYAVLDRPLFNDTIEAWKYGPVIPSLYHQTKEYGSSPVIDQLPAPIGDSVSQPEDEMLASVVENYGKMSGPQLSNLTHRPGSPWSKVWRDGSSHLEIPNTIIQEHYRRLKDSDKVSAA